MKKRIKEAVLSKYGASVQSTDLSEQFVSVVDAIVDDFIEAYEDGKISIREVIGIVWENMKPGQDMIEDFPELWAEIRTYTFEDIITMLNFIPGKIERLNEGQRAYIAEAVLVVSKMRWLITEFKTVW